MNWSATRGISLYLVFTALLCVEVLVYCVVSARGILSKQVVLIALNVLICRTVYERSVFEHATRSQITVFAFFTDALPS